MKYCDLKHYLFLCELYGWTSSLTGLSAYSKQIKTGYRKSTHGLQSAGAKALTAL